MAEELPSEAGGLPQRERALSAALGCTEMGGNVKHAESGRGGPRRQNAGRTITGSRPTWPTQLLPHGGGINTCIDHPAGSFAFISTWREVRRASGSQESIPGQPGGAEGYVKSKDLPTQSPTQSRDRTREVVWVGDPWPSSTVGVEAGVGARPQGVSPDPMKCQACRPHSRSPFSPGPWGTGVWTAGRAKLSSHSWGRRREGTCLKAHGVHLEPGCHRPGRPSPPALCGLPCSPPVALLDSRKGGNSVQAFL